MLDLIKAKIRKFLEIEKDPKGKGITIIDSDTHSKNRSGQGKSDLSTEQWYVVWVDTANGINNIRCNIFKTQKGMYFNPDYAFKGFREDISSLQVISWQKLTQNELTDFNMDYKEYWGKLNNKPASECPI